MGAQPAALPLPVPVGASCPGPVPSVLTCPSTLAEEKVTPAPQPQATCQGSPVAGMELCHQESKLLHCHADPVSFLIVYSRTETWLRLCISKRRITMYFPKQESPWPLSAQRRAAALNVFPQGLKIPGSISQTRFKDVVPASPPPAVWAEVRSFSPAHRPPEGGWGWRGTWALSWGIMGPTAVISSCSTFSKVIHAFISSELFPEHLLCAQHCWGHNSERQEGCLLCQVHSLV